MKPLRRDAGQRQDALLIEEEDASVRVDHLRPGKAALLPQRLARLDVDRGQEGRAEIPARAVDGVAEADGGAEVDAQAIGKP